MNHFLQLRSVPLVIAHRGASANAPENTLTAFTLAVEQGADAIELDVDLTRDGQLVVMHDATIDRTTNGHGRVTDLTWDEIRRVDAGAWKGTAFKGERVPLLAEVLAAVGQRLLINIEIKDMSVRDHGLEVKIANLIKHFDMLERVMISSFSPFALRRMKQGEPRAACGLLYAPNLPLVLRRAWLAPLIPGLNARHPHYSQVTPALVAACHARRQQINVWTVNEAASAQAMARVGVDGIIGDDPMLIRQALGET